MTVVTDNNTKDNNTNSNREAEVDVLAKIIWDYMHVNHTIGGFGNLTLGVFPKPEAEMFADVAIQMGVPKDMERRVYATFEKQWPNPEGVKIVVTSPNIPYDEYFGGKINKNEVIRDLQRIKVYPEKGFQIYQEIPDNVWDAFVKLVVDYGFNTHLIN